MQTESKNRALVLSMTVCIVIIGIVPWILRLLDKTKDMMGWLGDIGYQHWGWLVVLCLSFYTLNLARKWHSPVNSERTIAVGILIACVIWSILWALLSIFGYIVSTIV